VQTKKNILDELKLKVEQRQKKGVG
jgi:hypothetical protein